METVDWYSYNRSTRKQAY